MLGLCFYVSVKPKATLGSAPCACVLVCSLYINSLQNPTQHVRHAPSDSATDLSSSGGTRGTSISVAAAGCDADVPAETSSSPADGAARSLLKIVTRALPEGPAMKSMREAYIWICISIYLYLYTDLYIYIYIYTDLYMSIGLTRCRKRHACPQWALRREVTRVNPRIYRSASLYICIHINVYISISLCICINIYTYIYTYISIYIAPRVPAPGPASRPPGLDRHCGRRIYIYIYIYIYTYI